MCDTMTSKRHVNYGSISSGFGAEIRKYRQARGLLVREAAAQLGIDPSMLSKYENGHILPNREFVSKIAKFYSVDVRILFTAVSADRFLKEFNSVDEADSVIKLIQERLAPYITDNS